MSEKFMPKWLNRNIFNLGLISAILHNLLLLNYFEDAFPTE